MNNSRLSLADFKAKAEITNTDAVLEKVQGGESSGCHGFWGQIGKAWDEFWEDPKIHDPVAPRDNMNPL